MSAHGQTITWGLHIGKSRQDAQGHWLQRIGQWFVGRSKSHGVALRMILDRVWDNRRERSRPSQAESDLEQGRLQDAAGNPGSSPCTALPSKRGGVAFHRLPAPVERWGIVNCRVHD